ncbi:hypothetical protein JG688_00008316 [Phytophthora aleatoria]|uniref:Uncharacterized protein n=1 Tax=Phytophthora aleatoria TaxID=2496075 RepID=A0A8J5J761_9STRA|nr:hypothetical protein JG688_00008316 [Phytophthora aleatoria]
MSVGELQIPSEEKILVEDPTDEDHCCVDTNSENEIRSELSSANATGMDDGDAAGSTQTPENLSAEKLGLKVMAQLFVSADVMGISSREVIGLRSMQREFRKELGRKQDGQAASVNAGLHLHSFCTRFISIVNYL